MIEDNDNQILFGLHWVILILTQIWVLSLSICLYRRQTAHFQAENDLLYDFSKYQGSSYIDSESNPFYNLTSNLRKAK